MRPVSTELLSVFWRIARRPNPRRWLWRLVYQFLADFDEPSLAFLNYGYASIVSEERIVELDPSDEPYKYGINLYHHLANTVDFVGKRVLEVGCGQGGGCAYFTRYHVPRVAIGLDCVAAGLTRCRARHPGEKLAFVCGDAEALGVRSESVDIVVNIESSHCYGSMARFLDEGVRVLRSGGYFLIADFRAATDVDDFRTQLNQTPMAVIRETDITANVIAALGHDSPRRKELVRRFAPRLLRRSFEQFAGIEDSSIYNGFRSGAVRYLTFVLRKE